jgi:hypothetical protein
MIALVVNDSNELALLIRPVTIRDVEKFETRWPPQLFLFNLIK